LVGNFPSGIVAGHSHNFIIYHFSVTNRMYLVTIRQVSHAAISLIKVSATSIQRCWYCLKYYDDIPRI